MLTIFCCLWPIKLMGRNAWLSESQWQILYLFLCVLWSRLHALTVNMQVNLTLIRCVTGPVWCDVTITSPVGMVAKYCDECVCAVCVCLSVCESVCLSVCEHISGTTRVIFTNFSVHVAYGHGSALLWQGDEIPRGRGSFGGFLPHWQCIVTRSLQMGSAGKGVMGVYSMGKVWSTIALLQYSRSLFVQFIDIENNFNCNNSWNKITKTETEKL